jgi:tellurite resistance protein
MSLDTLVGQFQQSLVDCRSLYARGAAICGQQHPQAASGSSANGGAGKDFAAVMEDLHRGLLIKTYVTVAQVNPSWSSSERRLAETLLAHLWGVYLSGDKLDAAARQICQQSRELYWDTLIRPFQQLAPLREFAGELETIVMRIANLVAKIDGGVCPQEADVLLSIQHELDSRLKRGENRDSRAAGQPAAHGAQAFDRYRGDAKEVREHYKITPPTPPPVVGSGSAATADKSPEELLQEALAELDDLIGLDAIKTEIRTLTNFLRIEQERKKHDLPATSVTLHQVYRGNPGTGKTTVARIVGRIYSALGVLKKGHLVETDRAGLVAEYAGQTAPKTHKTIDAALDGVLFIDEAYSLVDESNDDPYGREAMQTLLKRMEDDRSRLVVILAGYPEPIDRLVETNPGIASRFPHSLTFPDYTAVELAKIFERLSRQSRYTLPSLTRARLLVGFQWLYENRDERFGNGRTARNTFERAIRRLANRVAKISPLTKEHLTVLDPQDVLIDSAPASLFAGLGENEKNGVKSKLRFRARCINCHQESRIAPELLGRDVKCVKCETTFAVDWAEP